MIKDKEYCTCNQDKGIECNNTCCENDNYIDCNNGSLNEYCSMSMSYIDPKGEILTVSKSKIAHNELDDYNDVGDVLSLTESFLSLCSFVVGERKLALVDWDYEKEYKECKTTVNPIKALKAGFRIKRKDWKGCWYYEYNTGNIEMLCYDELRHEYYEQNLKDTKDWLFTLNHLTHDDWEIVDD